MSWSTRELADLAGTTVNTVRHYHALGLLEDPERRYNGYKQYRVQHLVELIHIRRLVELGIPLAQIRDVDAGSTQALRDADAELQADIARLEEARADVAAILGANAPLDAPRGFEMVAAQLTEADRSLVHICTRLYPPERTAMLARMVGAEPEPLRRAFGTLAPDADERSRVRLARRIAERGVNWRAVGGPDRIGRTLADVLEDLYNPAQNEVIQRAVALAA